MKGKVKKRIRIRNWLAIHAHNRSRAGPHLDKKKHKNKYKCRKTAKNNSVVGGFSTTDLYNLLYIISDLH